MPALVQADAADDMEHSQHGKHHGIEQLGNAHKLEEQGQGREVGAADSDRGEDPEAKTSGERAESFGNLLEDEDQEAQGDAAAGEDDMDSGLQDALALSQKWDGRGTFRGERASTTGRAEQLLTRCARDLQLDLGSGRGLSVPRSFLLRCVDQLVLG